MSNIIIYYEGAYNLYNMISDSPRFASALTLEQLKKFVKEEWGNEGVRRLPERLRKVHEKGTSSQIDESLEEQIICNRAGKNEKHLSYVKFIEKFLTVEPPK